MGLTIKELLPIGEKTLKDAGVENYMIDAGTLYCFAAGTDKKELFLNQDSVVNETYKEEYFSLIDRRAAGEPLQYITGEQYFMGHRLAVDPSVLIPRPETEILAEKAVDYLHSYRDAKAVLDLCTGSGAGSVLDLCTGSGALAVSIAIACPDIQGTASDISADALAVAEQNAKDLGVSDRVVFIESDLFDAFGHVNKFDLIVTNPPYIRSGDFAGLAREITEHEPVLALDGGADGLDFYRRIAADARACMNPGACLMTEIGFDQAEDVTAILTDAGFTIIEVIRDYNGLDRVLITGI